MAKPIPVSFNSNAWDRKVRSLGTKGFFVRTIAAQCGLTTSQAAYRLRKCNVSPLAYRKGEGAIAQKELQRYDNMIGTCREMQRQIARFLKQNRNKR